MTKVEIERARTVCAVLNEIRSETFQIQAINAAGFVLSCDTDPVKVNVYEIGTGLSYFRKVAPTGFDPAKVTGHRFDLDADGYLLVSPANPSAPWHRDALKAWNDYRAAGK